MKYLLSAVGISALAACGGGSSGDESVNYVGLFVTSSTETSSLRSIDLQSGETGATAGETFDRENDRITINGLPGTINADRTSVALDEGGVVTITNSGLNYVALFQADPVSGDPFVGVIGQQTAVSDLPTAGTYDYDGTDNVLLQITDGDDFYDLTGDGFIAVNFDSSSRASLTVDTLSGSRTTGVNAPENVSLTGFLSVFQANRVGNNISGGSAFVSLSDLENGSLSGQQVVDLNASLFGPNAEEIGGVFLIDYSVANNLLIEGSFVAEVE